MLTLLYFRHHLDGTMGAAALPVMHIAGVHRLRSPLAGTVPP
jgi:hypothetical protein